MVEMEQAGREAANSTTLDLIARIGLTAYGVVHVLIGWLAVQLAVGDHSEDPSAQGAFHTLAAQPAGGLLVGGVAIGLFLLVAWRVVQAVFGYREFDGFERTSKRLGAAGQAAVYAALGGLAAKTVLGIGQSSGEKGLTAKVLDLPAGPVIVVAVGVGVLATAVGFVWFAVTGRFDKQIDAEGKRGDSGTAYLLLGRIGYLAKATAFAIVGGLVCYAGVTHRSRESGGLDEALQRVLHQPFGPALLVVIGLGIGCFGLFTFVRARHLRR